MKLAVVSDIHGNLGALHAVLEDIARESVDGIVNLGDILSGPLQPAETADFLMTQSFVTIRGNHERQLLALIDGPRERIDPGTSDGYAREIARTGNRRGCCPICTIVLRTRNRCSYGAGGNSAAGRNRCGLPPYPPA